MVFFVGEENKESEDVRYEDLNIVQVGFLDALQLLRNEVNENLSIMKKQALNVRKDTRVLLIKRILKTALKRLE